MRLPRLLAAIVVASLAGTAVACRGGGAPSLPALPVAVASPGCGPADGPATVIVLAPTSAAATAAAPSSGVQVSLWRSVTTLVGHSWPLSHEGSASGIAMRWPSSGDSTVAAEGTITIDAVGADKSVRGRVDLRFADDTRLVQAFRATWVERTVRCG